MPVTETPWLASRTGRTTQTRPSLRLLTRPAWLTAASGRSFHETRAVISRAVRGGPGRPGMLAGLRPRRGAGVAHRDYRQGKPGDGVAHSEQLGSRAQPEP